MLGIKPVFHIYLFAARFIYIYIYDLSAYMSVILISHWWITLRIVVYCSTITYSDAFNFNNCSVRRRCSWCLCHDAPATKVNRLTACSAAARLLLIVVQNGHRHRPWNHDLFHEYVPPIYTSNDLQQAMWIWNWLRRPLYSFCRIKPDEWICVCSYCGLAYNVRQLRFVLYFIGPRIIH